MVLIQKIKINDENIPENIEKSSLKIVKSTLGMNSYIINDTQNNAILIITETKYKVNGDYFRRNYNFIILLHLKGADNQSYYNIVKL